MKNLRLAVILFIAVLGFTPAAEVKAQSVSVNFSLFQRELTPYGRWMTNPRFGEVWVYNDPGFRPYYTDGHWEYTNYGWAWVSDFDWGWAPFHYGRWENDPSYGWMWIPGYDWGAAWVSWSSYDDYYGWAPLGYGVSINVSFGSIPYDRWTFIPRGNICDRDINRYYVSPERNRGFRNAVVINNYYGGNNDRGRFMRGPERDEVQRYTHNNIQERRIDDRERQGRWTANNDNNRGNDHNGNGNNNGGRRNDGQQGRGDNNPNGNGNNGGRRNNDQQNGGVASNDNNHNGNGNGQWGGRRNNDQQPRTDNNPNNGNGNNPGERRNNDQQPRTDNNPNNANGNSRWGGRRNNDQQPRTDNNPNNGNGNNQWGGRRPADNNRQPNTPQQQAERPARPQQPATEQRRMDRRDDQGGGGQRSNGNGNGNGQGGNQNRGGGHGRRG